MQEPILEALDVFYRYPDGTGALTGATLTIERGQKVAILGPNGAGKSTLFLHFNGLLRPEKGQIRFHGEVLRYDRSSLWQLRQRVGIVFQDPDTQLFSASVRQEISFGPLNLGLKPPETQRRVEAAMAATGVSSLADRPTHFLSHGQKKRVAIADVLAMEPEVLIADEPTAGLDPAGARHITDLLTEINGRGTTVVISTHDVDLAYTWADVAFVMAGGQVIAGGKPEEVFEQDELLVKAELEKPWLLEVHQALLRGGCSGSRSDRPRQRRELLEMILAMTGR